MKKVFFLNVYTSKGTRVYIKHPRRLNKKAVLSARDHWKEKGYRAEVIEQVGGCARNLEEVVTPYLFLN